jgi:hypothetical protein
MPNEAAATNGHAARRATHAFIALRVGALTADYGKGFLLPLLVFKQTHGNALAVGVAYCVEFLPRALLSPIFGSLIDRSIGKREVWCAETLRLALMLLWAALGTARGAWLLSSAVSFLSGLILVYYEATAAQRLDHGSLRSFQSHTQMLEPAARLAGPGALAIVLSVASIDWAIVTIALVYGALLVLSIASRASSGRIARATEERWSRTAELARLALLGRNTKLLFVTLASGVLNVFFGVFQALTAAAMIGLYGSSPSASALPNVAGGASALVLCLLAPRWLARARTERYGMIGALCIGASAALAVLDLGSAAFCAAFALLIAGSTFFGIFFRARRFELIPAPQLAQGIAATASVTTAFLPLAGLITAAGHRASPLIVIGLTGAAASLVMLGAVMRSSGPARVATEREPITSAERERT